MKTLKNSLILLVLLSLLVGCSSDLEKLKQRLHEATAPAAPAAESLKSAPAFVTTDTFMSNTDGSMHVGIEAVPASVADQPPMVGLADIWQVQIGGYCVESQKTAKVIWDRQVGKAKPKVIPPQFGLPTRIEVAWQPVGEPLSVTVECSAAKKGGGKNIARFDFQLRRDANRKVVLDQSSSLTYSSGLLCQKQVLNSPERKSCTLSEVPRNHAVSVKGEKRRIR